MTQKLLNLLRNEKNIEKCLMIDKSSLNGNFTLLPWELWFYFSYRIDLILKKIKDKITSSQEPGFHLGDNCQLDSQTNYHQMWY
jgi:hypothetical protein